MFYHPIFAQSGKAAQEIIEQNTKVGREIQIAMKQTWLDVLQSPLFISVCNIGAILAGLCLLLFFFVWLKSVANPNDPAVMSVTTEKIVIVIMIFILIGPPVNRGKLLGTVVLAAHDVMVGITDELVSNLSANIDGDIIDQAQIKSALETQIPQEIEECLTIDDIPKRDFCLLRTDDKLKALLSDYSSQGWALQTYERFHADINNLLSSDSKDAWDPLGDYQGAVKSLWGGIGQGLAFQVIRSVLISFGSGYLILLEHGMLLTGLIQGYFILSKSSQTPVR